MKKSIILFAAVAALFSCAKENPTIETPAQETYSVTLTASAPTSEDAPSPASADTRTTLVDGPVVDGKPSKFVHWSKGDAIKVLFFPKTTEVNASFSGPSQVFQSNVTAAASAVADFSCAEWKWGDKVTELGVSKTLMDNGVAVYPYSVVATSSKPLNMSVNCNTEISFLLPSSQNAVENNIESGLNFSWAEVKLSTFPNGGGEKTTPHLRFNNACAIIELTMPSTLDKKVTSISLVSNSGVSLTGKGSVKLLQYYQNIVAEPFGVDITDGDGVTLLSDADGFKAGAKYYAVVWPGVHEGLTIEFKAEDGTVATKTTPAVTLTASKIKPYTFNKGLDFIAPVQEEFDYIYADGSTGNTVNSNIVGVIFFNGDPSGAMNDPDLAGKYTNGLAIGLKDYTIYWGTSSNTAPNWKYPSSVALKKGQVSNYNVGGYSTKNVWQNNNYILDIYTTDYGTLPSSTSGWYLAAPIEWKYIVDNLSEINAKLSAVGATTINIGTSSADGYWLPLAEYYAYDAFVVHGPENNLYFEDNEYTYRYTTRKSRPIFAF